MANDITPERDTLPEGLVPFAYRGWQFLCGADRLDPQTYRPLVYGLGKAGGNEAKFRLPTDTEEGAYGSEAEAYRHAEQQAVRWVHDRVSDGQAQF